MSNIESERLLAEVLGFDPETRERVVQQTKEGNNSLLFVPEDGNPRVKYPSWESIVGKNSKWRSYLAEPYELAVEFIAEGRKISRRRRKWVKRQNAIQEAHREYIEIAHQVIIFSELSHRSLGPWDNVVIETYHHPSIMHLNVGKIISAFRPSREDILKLANNSAWGPEGGFRTLSNIMEKPVTVKVCEDVSQVYYPHRAER